MRHKKTVKLANNGTWIQWNKRKNGPMRFLYPQVLLYSKD